MAWCPCPWPWVVVVVAGVEVFFLVVVVVVDVEVDEDEEEDDAACSAAISRCTNAARRFISASHSCRWRSRSSGVVSIDVIDPAGPSGLSA